MSNQNFPRLVKLANLLLYDKTCSGFNSSIKQSNETRYFKTIDVVMLCTPKVEAEFVFLSFLCFTHIWPAASIDSLWSLVLCLCSR